jgi:hypothetical protein
VLLNYQIRFWFLTSFIAPNEKSTGSSCSVYLTFTIDIFNLSYKKYFGKIDPDNQTSTETFGAKDCPKKNSEKLHLPKLDTSEARI